MLFNNRGVKIKMKDDYIENMTNNDLTFGKIVQRERKKLGKSLKNIEKELTVVVKEVKDGVIVEKDKPLITASYMNRIENGNRENISFDLVWVLIEKFNLDINEVLKSFGHEGILSNNAKQSSLEAMIRISDIEFPIKIGDKIEKQSLSNTDKEILIRIINDANEVANSSDDTIIYTLKKILEELDDYRKSRKKLK